MKVNIVTLLISLGIAALCSYAFFAINSAETDIPLANAIGGGVALFVTLAGTLSVSFESGKGPTLNIRVISSIFFVIMLVQQIIFCFIKFNLPSYIIITGLLVLIYLLIVYKSSKTV